MVKIETYGDPLCLETLFEEYKNVLSILIFQFSHLFFNFHDPCFGCCSFYNFARGRSVVKLMY